MTSDLSIPELQTALVRLLQAVEQKHGPALLLSEDYYWNVPFGQATSLEGPPELDLGSASDDLEALSDVRSRPSAEVPVLWHDLDHLAGLLRSIARIDAAN
ncbi:hypothetical protein [Propionicimonas sp.]|uniref:hypothetical protein n=1 Tax=Propionicimonas sp. TaxID=1955623 RepID=UPI00180F2B40|nr:hypothetical protein [Propionicimonas sp.]MBU3976417.1 hypothetical protein [Actinomycetota bacterium]MBA3021991.1 hypothetical protein [Propionicimonas sp.]MBU3987574.1 hypothetical protein [Actinomycetota bacterium]MBU4006481.1 hypothetical protein [Actinomycetota bacterium]MBU4065086.1 hypothetical protein [Actinomycetota bacterium]